MTDSQRELLFDLCAGLAAHGGEITEIRELVGFVGVTVHGGGLRRDGGDAELLVMPNGSAHVGVVAVPTGTPVSWETIEQAQRDEEARSAAHGC